MFESLELQNQSFLSEFSGKSLPEIQKKCNNLQFECECMEYGDCSVVIIKNGRKTVLLISVGDTGNKYMPLNISPVK